MTSDYRFPPEFLWGAATSAYQIEGSPLADGAGPSIWHRFSHTPGATDNGDTGDVACDHYRRAESDVLLMRQLGLTAYRFSIAWGRVLPAGRGAVNPPGLAFYDRLVDCLLEQNILPSATLYHWDLPAALDDQGGWLNRDVAGWFADYAAAVVRRLGDRVAMWTTLNEPWVVSDAGYLHGIHAPGHASLSEAAIVSHNLLRSHGAGMQAIRAEGGRQAGLVVNLEPKYPATDRPEDIAAAARAEAYMNRQFLDPVFLGHYPEELAEAYGADWPKLPKEDFALIGQPLDFLGINYYTRNVTRHDAAELPLRAGRVRQDQNLHTLLDWEVYPQALTDVLLWVRDRYGSLPLYITENGAAFDDPPTVDGPVLNDPLRVAYLRDHLRAAHTAVRQGVDLRGYFAWSLMDNFEWSAGYSKRFGLYHVDFESQRRTPKASAEFYSSVIASAGEALGH
ncbi:MAG TPA: GH1 family beta-glucosidase [Gemmatimonadales bacterium]|nr:GH1 family beta-glucosidase [Gemmatimonadales bacterium]